MYQQPDITPAQVAGDLLNTAAIGLLIFAFLFVMIYLPYYICKKTNRK